jgi:hypothetical protein
MSESLTPLDSTTLKRGTELFLARLEEIVDSESDIPDIHAAFEFYCTQKFSLGNLARNHRVGGKGDLGIDFYSQNEHAYHVGQCKIPEADWLEAHPTDPKPFGPQALADARDALLYLLGDSSLKANEQVQQLFTLIQSDRSSNDFSLVFFIIVYGRLKPRGIAEFNELQAQYQDKRVSLVLLQMDDLVEEFLIGSKHSAEKIKFELRIRKGELLRAHQYCYFLANAADLHDAFLKFGWRLFDLNLRYEVRNSAINGEIIESLSFSKSRKRFHHYNNGLIVVARNYSMLDHDLRIRLEDAQIVNGLQTLKSIYNAVATRRVQVEELDKECVVQVKVISTEEIDFVSKVVRSTNNQNPMAARNLRSNNREQKILRKEFQMLSPKWFYQVKEGEWKSLTGEDARFFEQVVGVRSSEFRPEPSRKFARVVDNQTAAKAWLAFIGFADESGDRVTHFFSEDKVYELAFGSRPTDEYWNAFAHAIEWDSNREEKLDRHQGEASQYLLAVFLWEFTNGFLPTPQRYREIGLDEGVRAGKLVRASGSITSSAKEQDAYLAENRSYQTWRLMANMKELLTEVASQILARRYGPLQESVCRAILISFEANQFNRAGEIREVAQNAAFLPELTKDYVFSRIFRMLHYVSQQFWEEKKQLLLSTSRLRTLLLKREISAVFKELVWEVNGRVNLDRPWKEEGVTFIDSLPSLSKE